MGFKLEMAEQNMATLEITVEEEKFEKSVQSTVKKIGKQVNIPGFRKGKAPRHILERHVGKEYILEEAAQPLIGPAYFETLDEADMDPIAPPEVEIVQSAEGQPLIFTAKIQLPPDVELGQYVDLPVKEELPETTDEEVEQELKRRQESYAKMAVLEPDVPAEDGDIAVIDFVGYKDGIAFDGGKGDDYSLKLGSGTFIPGFEDQLIGAKTGEDVTINVTFPDEYQSEDLKGQPVVFEVKVKSIKRKELAVLDDEFAKDVSEFETLDEYKADIKKTMIESQASKFDQERRADLIKTVVDNAQVDIPEVMINERYGQMIRETQMSLEQQGITLVQYCQYFGMDIEKFVADIKVSAEEAVKMDLVLDAIARAENITCPEDEFMVEMTKLAQSRNSTAEAMIKMFRDQGELRNLKKSMSRHRAMEFVMKKNLPETESSGSVDEQDTEKSETGSLSANSEIIADAESITDTVSIKNIENSER